MTAQHANIKTKLAKNRDVLFAIVQDLTDEQWETAVYSEQTVWTVSDIVRHLAGAERSMITLMAQIREGGAGVPPDFDLARWNASRIQKAKEKRPSELLAEMEQNRAELLAFMDSLTAADWQKKGRHGNLRIMTIEETCHIIADHEAIHTNDIRESLEGIE